MYQFSTHAKSLPIIAKTPFPLTQTLINARLPEPDIAAIYQSFLLCGIQSIREKRIRASYKLNRSTAFFMNSSISLSKHTYDDILKNKFLEIYLTRGYTFTDGKHEPQTTFFLVLMSDVLFLLFTRCISNISEQTISDILYSEQQRTLSCRQ